MIFQRSRASHWIVATGAALTLWVTISNSQAATYTDSQNLNFARCDANGLVGGGASGLAIRRFATQSGSVKLVRSTWLPELMASRAKCFAK